MPRTTQNQKRPTSTLLAKSVTVTYDWVVTITNPFCTKSHISPEFGHPWCAWKLELTSALKNPDYYSLWLRPVYAPQTLTPRETTCIMAVRNVKGLRPASANERRRWNHNYAANATEGYGYERFVRVADVGNPDILTFTITITANHPGERLLHFNNTRQPNRLLLQNELSDVQLDVCECDNGEENHHLIPAHKAILIANSDYFSAMLTSGMSESQTSAIKITGFPLPAVTSMLDYIYNGSLCTYPPTTFDQRMDLLLLADQYQLIHLFEQISDMVVAKDLNVDTAVRICCFGINHKHTLPVLKVAGLKYMKDHMAEISQCEAYAQWWKDYGDMDVMAEAMVGLTVGEER